MKMIPAAAMIVVPKVTRIMTLTCKQPIAMMNVHLKTCKKMSKYDMHMVRLACATAQFLSLPVKAKHRKDRGLIRTVDP